jgi:PD-(D/E)XK nuclease superfamily
MVNVLEEINPHERDGKKNGSYTSVTKLLDIVCPLKTPDALMKEKMQKGTKLHADIEKYYNGVESGNTSVEFRQFISFANYARDELELEPYRTEWCIYDDDLSLSGTIDMIFRKKNDPHIFYLYDWKRSRKVHRNQVYRYSTQLNLYRTILERSYNIKVNRSFLVLFHPDNDKYVINFIPDRKVTKYLSYSIEIGLGATISPSDECPGESQRKTKKRKLNEPNDNSNPLKWMAGRKKRKKTLRIRNTKYKKKNFIRDLSTNK